MDDNYFCRSAYVAAPTGAVPGDQHERSLGDVVRQVRCHNNRQALKSLACRRREAMFARFAVAVAQLVEHWIVAPDVAGSSPVGHPAARLVLIPPQPLRNLSSAMSIASIELASAVAPAG